MDFDRQRHAVGGNWYEVEQPAENKDTSQFEMKRRGRKERGATCSDQVVEVERDNPFSGNIVVYPK